MHEKWCPYCGRLCSEAQSDCDFRHVVAAADSDDSHSGDEEPDDEEEEPDDNSQALVRVNDQSSVAKENDCSHEGSCSAGNRYTRAQCWDCKVWFNNQAEEEEHHDENSGWCEEHSVCFPNTNYYNHARSERHSRCFASRCDSKYRRDGGWPDSNIEEHIWYEHTQRAS